MPAFDLFEAMHTQRAIRHFKPVPVPPELIHQVLSAAIRARVPATARHGGSSS